MSGSLAPGKQERRQRVGILSPPGGGGCGGEEGVRWGAEEVGGGGETCVRQQEPNQEVFLSTRVSAAAGKTGQCKLEPATGGCGWN